MTGILFENYPLTNAEHAEADEEYQKLASRQRELLEKIAEKIEAGDSIQDGLERRFAAGAIRAFASSIPPERPDARATRVRGKVVSGRPKKLPSDGDLALKFAFLIAGGHTSLAACEKIASDFKADKMAVRQRLYKTGGLLKPEVIWVVLSLITEGGNVAFGADELERLNKLIDSNRVKYKNKNPP